MCIEAAPAPLVSADSSATACYRHHNVFRQSTCHQHWESPRMRRRSRSALVRRGPPRRPFATCKSACHANQLSRRLLSEPTSHCYKCTSTAWNATTVVRSIHRCVASNDLLAYMPPACLCTGLRFESLHMLGLGLSVDLPAIHHASALVMNAMQSRC